MPGLDSLLCAVPVVAGCFSLHRDCFASGAGLGTIGLAWWDSGEGLRGAAAHSLSLFPPLFSRARDIFPVFPVFLLLSFLPCGCLIVRGAQEFWAMGLTWVFWDLFLFLLFR